MSKEKFVDELYKKIYLKKGYPFASHDIRYKCRDIYINIRYLNFIHKVVKDIIAKGDESQKELLPSLYKTYLVRGTEILECLIRILEPVPKGTAMYKVIEQFSEEVEAFAKERDLTTEPKEDCEGRFDYLLKYLWDRRNLVHLHSQEITYNTEDQEYFSADAELIRMILAYVIHIYLGVPTLDVNYRDKFTDGMYCINIALYYMKMKNEIWELSKNFDAAFYNDPDYVKKNGKKSVYVLTRFMEQSIEIDGKNMTYEELFLKQPPYMNTLSITKEGEFLCAQRILLGEAFCRNVNRNIKNVRNHTYYDLDNRHCGVGSVVADWVYNIKPNNKKI